MVIIVIIISGFIYLNGQSTTSAVAFVVDINDSDSTIIVENLDKERTTVRVPRSTIKLIETDSEYFVVYKYNKWTNWITTPKLSSIEP
ncbi:hypothetical protein VQL36_05650 [Chengkuizengella sp. SCS-71B]|uniref:hypothetical protein n=1 Tax=Chengkuizengella sp. SCS-71B TaxID=3115290 RepID=UPI0032C21012